MIDVVNVQAKLAKRFPGLERVSDFVFRAVDTYNKQPYAVRYFDVSDDLRQRAKDLQEYQDRLIGPAYYDSRSKADLRWNHYLYFINTKPSDISEFTKLKADVEANREYARKTVILEDELDTALEKWTFGTGIEQPPLDPVAIWTTLLKQHGLAFVVDEAIEIPAIVRNISDGDAKQARHVAPPPSLNAAEQAVPRDLLGKFAHEFRRYPIQKTFDFGSVNLIVGANGAGKTSLLEAIEYLFCGATRRAAPKRPQTAVTSVLVNSGLTLETRNNTSVSKLRARHLAWYGKNEPKRITLHNSFSTFNFLDTDAATRLTVEQSSDRLLQDLALLLLGSEAAKALDRLDRVVHQLETTGKDLENSISIKDEQHSNSLARLEELRNAPTDSDQLFHDLTRALHELGWRKPPVGKEQIEELMNMLSRALVHVAVLKSTEGALSFGTEDLDILISRIDAAATTLSELAKADSDRRRSERQLKVRFEVTSKRLNVIEEVGRLLSAGINKLHERHRWLANEVQRQNAALQEREIAAAALSGQNELIAHSLAQALTAGREALRAASEHAAKSRERLTRMEESQALLTTLLIVPHGVVYEFVSPGSVGLVLS